MNFTKTLNKEQCEALSEMFYASFRDFYRETQSGAAMPYLADEKAKTISRLLVDCTQFVVSPEFKEGGAK